MEVLTILLSISIGFLVFNIITHPYSLIRNSLPVVRFKRVQVLPTLRVRIKDRTIHFHHWMNFSILLLLTLTPLISGGFLDYTYTRGFLVGGVLQGLILPDARKIIY